MNADSRLVRVGLTVVVAVAVTIAFLAVGNYGGGNGMVLAVLLVAGTLLLGFWLVSRERSKGAGVAVFAGLALAVLGQVIFFLAFLSWLGERTT